MSRRTLGSLAAAVLLIAVATAFALQSANGNGDDPSATDQTTAATATTEIERRDLVETDSVDGTLGYADERTVPVHAQGTLTWLPAEGATVKPDHRLFQVDGEDVFLLDGRVPAWRTLASGTEGDDVLQLERNLQALGYDPYEAMTVDGEWDGGTTSAVLRWQEAHQLDETGSIELGRVIFQPGPRRIGTLRASLGGRAGGDLMTTTSTRRVVEVEVSPSKLALAKRGARVQVELPDGDTVPGRIATIARVATLPSSDASASDATVTVTIRLSRKHSNGSVDQAPVEVLVERSRARDVLAIPTSALLARSGGGFAVELREQGRRRIVPVRTGLTASGYVAIAGTGLQPGMRVTNGAL